MSSKKKRYNSYVPNNSYRDELAEEEREKVIQIERRTNPEQNN